MINPEKFKSAITQLEDEDGSRARRRDVVESINVLLRSTRAQTVVEVGSSSGYVSLWLALGTQSTGGSFHLFDNNKSRIDAVKAMMTDIGFENVYFHNELPTESTNLPKNIDFVVLDHDRSRHLEFYTTLFPQIIEGGTIVTDDAIAEFADLREYINEVRMGDQSSSVLFPLGEGIEVTTKSRSDDPLNSLYTDLIR